MQSSPSALPAPMAEVPQHQTVAPPETADKRGLLPLVPSPLTKSASSEQMAHIVGIHQKSKPCQVIIALTLFARGG